MSVYETLKDLPREARTIHRIFKKGELQEIAEELGLVVGRKNTRQLVLEIVNDLEEKGIPALEDTSDSLFEFLLNLDFIDAEGNILEIKKEEKPYIPPEEIKVSTKPECYSLADVRDPACKRCILIDECLQQRIIDRPQCFGKLFLEGDAECKRCIEVGPCREVLNATEKA